MALIYLDFFKNLTWLNYHFIDNKALLATKASISQSFRKEKLTWNLS